MKKNQKIKLIPKNTFYCYTADGLDIKNYTNGLLNYQKCPFFTRKKTDFGFKIKGEHKEWCEYCKLLHKFLSVQDGVKDCPYNLPYDLYDDFLTDKNKRR